MSEHKCRIYGRKLSSELSIKRQARAHCHRLWKSGYRGVQIKQFENVSKLEKKLDNRR